jgi:hypothetical protein
MPRPWEHQCCHREGVTTQRSVDLSLPRLPDQLTSKLEMPKVCAYPLRVLEADVQWASQLQGR